MELSLLKNFLRLHSLLVAPSGRWYFISSLGISNSVCSRKRQVAISIMMIAHKRVTVI